MLEAFSEQVVGKSKEGEEEVRSAALEGVLMEAHALFTMFYGSIRALLQKHPAGDAARSCLHAFLPDYLAGTVLRRSDTFSGMSQDIKGVFIKCQRFYTPQFPSSVRANLGEIWKYIHALRTLNEIG